MARLETVYKEKILPALVEQFDYKSIMDFYYRRVNNAKFSALALILFFDL